MSNTTHEDTLPLFPAGTPGDSPPARKRAAKKAAVTAAPAKKAAVTAAPAKKAADKKVAVKKAAAKKAAVKKSAAKVQADAAPATAPATLVPVPVEPAPQAKTVRAKKPPAAPAAPVATPDSIRHEAAPSPVEEPKRFGRVPGGGPVAPREPQAISQSQRGSRQPLGLLLPLFDIPCNKTHDTRRAQIPGFAQHSVLSILLKGFQTNAVAPYAGGAD